MGRILLQMMVVKDTKALVDDIQRLKRGGERLKRH